MLDGNTVSAWLQMLACAALISHAGVKLSRYGDVIAEKTGLGGGWIGLALVATVTSLPELVTGLSSVTLANTPNIAVGDVLGSCVFNLFILVVLDFLYRHESVYTRASHGHILSAGFGIVLIGFTGFNILLADHGRLPAIGHVGLSTPIIAALYLIALRTVFHYEKEHAAEFVTAHGERYADIPLVLAYRRYAAAAAMVVLAALWLPFAATQLADAMGWHKTFVGSLFVAFSTSLPELVVTISAIKLGALDMAIGNLLGSNLFNIAILAIDDVFYTPGPLLAQVSQLHALSAASAVIMTGTAVVGLLYRPSGRVLRTVGWISLFLFTIYLLNTYALYLHGE